MRRNKRNITTRSNKNRNRSRSPSLDNSPPNRNRNGRNESITTRNFRSKRDTNIQTKSGSGRKKQNIRTQNGPEIRTKNGPEIRTKNGPEIRTKNGPPPSSSRKRKLELPKNFQTSSQKRQMREDRFKPEAEPAQKTIEIRTKSGNPDSKNKKAVGDVLTSKPKSPAPSPPKRKPDPPVVERRRQPIAKPVVPPTARISPRKAFVTLRPDPVISSSDEDSDSESESDRATNYEGPKLEVKADGALILVRNLPKDVTTRDLLLELFAKTPGIEQVSIHTDENGVSTGTADVAISDVATARDVIARSRSYVYRDHEIYMTLLGTNTVTNTAEQVITPMPKELRTKKEKRRKKKRKDSSKSDKERKSAPAAASPPSAKPATQETKSPKQPDSPPKARNLRMLTPNCVDPSCRPWNWGTPRGSKKEYVEEYIIASWDEPDDTYYHVTMKKELQDHLPGVGSS